MTYSIIAQCPRTGAFGGAVGTSSLAVGNRCLHVAHGVGAFLSQHRTDPRIGELLGACEQDPALSSGDTVEAANIREFRREYDLATKLPVELVTELARVGSQSQEVA